MRGLVAALVYAACGVVSGLAIGSVLWRRPVPVSVDTPAVAQRQADSSLILKRDPFGKAKPAQQIPKGATIERVVSVVVQPSARIGTSVFGTAAPNGLPDSSLSGQGDMGDWKPLGDSVPQLTSGRDSSQCPPVRVDLTLVRLKDQSRRVIASSPDGQVVGGVDVPVESIERGPVLKWSIGPVYTSDRQVGGFVDRDVGRLHVGVAGVPVLTPSGRQLLGEARVGWRF